MKLKIWSEDGYWLCAPSRAAGHIAFGNTPSEALHTWLRLIGGLQK